MSIQLFGAVDRTKDGRIASEYPAYTFPRQIENLKEEIGMKSRALESGSVDRDSENDYRMILEREQKRLEEIEASRPKLTDVEKDMCAKAYKEIASEVGGSLPTRSDIERNLVDAHEEHRRNSQPCIKVSGKTAEIAEANGIRITDNCEMSRKDAWKLAKILGHVIGENTNMERLRKDGFMPVVGRRPKGR